MIFNREEQHLMLEGSVLSKEDVKRLVACHTEEASGFLYELYRFLEEWFSDSPYLTVKTSGSTGTPKLLKVRKEQMMQSARLTCEFLGLRQGDSVLLCMPLQYIAGKMVVVRALVAGDVDPKLIEDNMPFAGVLLKKDKDLQTLRKQKR